MKNLIIISTIYFVLIFSNTYTQQSVTTAAATTATATTAAPSCESCKDKSFRYHGCDRNTGTTITKCLKNKEPGFTPWKMCLPALLNFNQKPDGVTWDFLWVESGEKFFDFDDAKQVAYQSLNDWSSICTPSNENCNDCPLKIRWVRYPEDMDGHPNSNAITMGAVSAPGNPCTIDCEKYEIRLNFTNQFFGLDENDDINSDESVAKMNPLFYTDRNATKPSGINMVDLKSVLLHEMGHWLGFNHQSSAGCPSSGGVDQDEMVTRGLGLKYGDEWELTDDDKCMFMKLYCCETLPVKEELFLTGEYDFSIVPNPATLGKTLIKFTANLTSYRESIMVYNSLGKLIISKSVKSGETEALITTKNLVAGKYMISVTFDKLKGKIGRQLVIVK